jgi:hypothetical protein
VVLVALIRQLKVLHKRFPYLAVAETAALK